jgi:hypothetical protein
VLIAVDTDLTERLSLLALLLAAILIGGLLLLYPHGTSGNSDYLLRFLLGIPLCGLLGALVAERTRIFGPWCGAFVGIVGDLLVPGGLFLLFFASVGIGNGCLG